MAKKESATQQQQCWWAKPGHLPVFILYVDDACLSCPRQQDLEAFIESPEFLGIKYERDNDGSIHLTQRMLMGHFRMCLRGV